MPKALIIGTSNMVLRGGASAAIIAHFGAENVQNMSLGGTSGTYLAIFQILSRIPVGQYDYVFIDLMTNELCYDQMPLDHWENAARVFYRMLPAGPRYVFLGFFPRRKFFVLDPIEQMHRQLALESGVHFLSFRELLTEACVELSCAPAALFRPNDTMHIAAEVANIVVSELLVSIAPTLPPKRLAASVDAGSFFTLPAAEVAAETVERQTTLRTGRFGVFGAGSRIDLPEGVLLGLTVNSGETRAYLNIRAQSPVAKYCCFQSTRPYTFVVFFFREMLLGPGAQVTVEATQPPDIPRREWSDGAAPYGAPCTGTAELETFFFARQPLGALLARSGEVERLPLSRPALAAGALAPRVMARLRTIVRAAEERLVEA